MRRRVDDAALGPRRLRRYDPDDWAGDPVAYWAAVAHWRAEHPDTQLEPENGPDVPFDPATEL